MPEIEGKTVDQVAQLLGDESFVTTQSFEYNEKIKKGLVIGYEAHSAGDKLEYGSSVEIKVSLGSAYEGRDTDSDKKSSDKDSDSDSDTEAGSSQLDGNAVM